MTPYFPEKMRKYFFGCGCFSLLVPKNPFTYSHRERSNAHPEAQKILPLHLFGIERSKRTLFFRKQAKKLPANTGGHTFDTKNIIGLLKYSERIHIG